MARTAVLFGLEVAQPLFADPQWWDKLSLSQKAVSRSKRLITAVEANILGLRFTKDDIDILAPPGMTDDEVAEYQSLGWFLLVAGIVVIYGVYKYTSWLLDENEDLATKLNNVLYAADSNFCADSKSAVCSLWLKKKQSQGFDKKKSAIEKLESGIKKIGEVAKTGIGVGLAIAIPLLAWSFFGRRARS